MKKTKNKDPFQTFCWLREVIYDPYKVVTCCFENDSIVSYRKTIKKSLFFAEKKKIFHKGDPCNLVFDFKVLILLLKLLIALIAKTENLQVLFLPQNLWTPGFTPVKPDILPRGIFFRGMLPVRNIKIHTGH